MTQSACRLRISGPAAAWRPRGERLRPERCESKTYALAKQEGGPAAGNWSSEGLWFTGRRIFRATANRPPVAVCLMTGDSHIRRRLVGVFRRRSADECGDIVEGVSGWGFTRCRPFGSQPEGGVFLAGEADAGFVQYEVFVLLGSSPLLMRKSATFQSFRWTR